MRISRSSIVLLLVAMGLIAVAAKRIPQPNADLKATFIDVEQVDRDTVFTFDVANVSGKTIESAIGAIYFYERDGTIIDNHVFAVRVESPMNPGEKLRVKHVWIAGDGAKRRVADSPETVDYRLYVAKIKFAD